jgi:putative membrane protein
MRSFRDYFLLILKGAGMGAADVIPGVSGGTIAFITGIYTELINSLKSIDLEAFRHLFRGRIGTFFRHINGWFLVSVFGGILVSIFSLARLMKWLLLNYPIMVWSFFFGLILGSSLFVLGSAGKLRYRDWISFFGGIIAAWFITSVSPATTPDTWWFIILSGAIAICAMILPGISGAFILVLLGKYQFIITAVGEMQAGTLILFAVGAVTGLILFSNLLSWLLANFHTVTITTLAGFMIGSLNKIWPWKLTEPATAGQNVLPGAYLSAGESDPMIAGAAIMFAAGVLLMIILEFIGRRYKK